MKLRHKSARPVIALFMVALVVFGFGFKLFDIQIKNHDYFVKKNSTMQTYTVQIPAARGDIVDRNGNQLVTNRQGNSIILDATVFPSADDNEARNTIILNLINLFEKNGEEYVQHLPLQANSNGQIGFLTNDDLDEKDIATMKSENMLNLQPYATAQNCFDAVVEKYGLEKYDPITAIKIANIRYELTLMMFSYNTPVTIAEDVSQNTVAAVKDNTEMYKGADVRTVAYREYVDSTIAPHILGTVRKINAEEYEKHKDEGYKITDEIGESGIEYAMEKYLRGTDGEMTITKNSDGTITREVTKPPIQGDTVVLTIDIGLQKVAQDNLKAVCDKVDANSSAGAVVVEDVNTGELLAAASYPTYDLADYYEKYDQLIKDKRNPLWSRFALGTYAPGSTFKPAVACAALEEGVITKDTEFKCSGTMKFYDQTLQCLHQKAHGNENVAEAIRDSCNIFFYKTSLEIGINKMNEYCSMLGFGEKTGVEIPESKGVLAGRTERENAGGYWNLGDTVHAAIGQSDNLFTPLQLANYCSTIANGGTRYEAHFVKSVISKSNNAISYKEPKVAENTGFSKATLSTVQGGMRDVAKSGAPSRIFDKLNVNLAAKTGTSQVKVKGQDRNNGFLITYGPYENPEIAVSSVVELAGSGTETAALTSSVYNYYFADNSDEKKAENTATLLQ
ncbi:MAG: hypothetical protein DBY14_02895 [Escherichia coli]|nr:MAG: hypothetical protein DBY14_02895 [Escherichia coli]